METKTILDPICDMIVGVDDAREQGLTLEYPDREYAFCSAGCRDKFAKDPQAYVPKIEAWLAPTTAGHNKSADQHAHATSSEPEIDAGIRAWYRSCRCCLSDAHPGVVAVLDAEREATAGKPANAGICETAEGHEAKTT